MKLSPLPFFLVLSLFLFNGYSGYTQINLSFPQEPQHVNACEADSLNFFEITIGSNVASVDSIYIAMPPGIDYVPGSVQVTSSSDLVLIENDLSNLSRPVFVLNREILNPGDFVAFSIARRGACEAVVFSENGMLAYDTLGVWSGVDHFEEVSTNYNILYASIFTQYVNSNDTIVQDLPSTVCRDIQIVNGGTGYVSRIEHRVTPGSDLNDYTLNYQGVSLSPVQISGGTLVYVFDLASPPFAGTFGAEDTILQNGEVLIFEECFTVTNCSFSDGDVDHQSFWGCGSAICQTGNMVQGSVGLNFSQPDIRHAIDSLDNIVCMDGQDRGFIRMRVWNVGAGPLVVDQITLSAGGNNTAIDIDDINVFNANGENIQSYFPVGEPSGNVSCGSGFTNFPMTNNNFETSYQLHPDDTIYIEVFYVLCCPGSEICGPYTLSNPSITVSGTDLCGANRRNFTRNSGTGGTATVIGPIVSGTSVLSGGQITTLCAEYPTYQFLNVGDSDSSYVTFMVELPDGLVFNDYTNSTFSIGPNNIPIASSTVLGDSLLIHVLLSNVENQPPAPIKVCFEVQAVCPDGPGGLTSLNLGQSTNINCDPLCLVQLNCSTHDVLLLGCDIGECTETGGGTIFSYNVERVSYGFADMDGDRNWDDFVRANADEINLKRAMVGDTILHHSVLGFVEGSTTSWAGGFYRETYTHYAETLLCPDTAWITITRGIQTFVVGGLTPTNIQNGFEYNLSVDELVTLPGGEMLPSGFTFHPDDELNLYTKYAFCKENASEWLSIQPGVYRPGRERQNVIFTGSFSAVPADNPAVQYACNELFDEMLLLGAALSVDIKSAGFSGSGCDRDFVYLIEIEQNIGGVLSGYTGTYDFFPYELRPLYIPDSIVIRKPEDVTFRKAWLVTQQIEGLPDNPFPGQINEDIPLSLITETDSTLVLKVRQVHDAYGGNLFPYDEENADLRYYVAFQRSCESPRTISTDLAVAYTSLLCPDDEFQTIKEGLSIGTNTNLYDIDYNQIPTFRNADNNNTCFTLQINPRGGNLSYTWLQFPDNPDVTILSVSEGGVPISPQADGIYDLGSHTGNVTRDIVICVDLNSCDEADFQVIHGWSCYGYPSEENTESCSYDTMTFSILPVPSVLQLDLITQPSVNTPANSPDFCAPLYYEVVVNSANAGSVLNPRIEMTIPVGFEIQDIELEYPNGSNTESILSSVEVDENVLSIDLTAHSLLVDSLPGTATVLTPENRQILLRILGYTSCDFVSGSQLFFTGFGERPCGGPVTGNGIRRASNRLFINDLLPYQVNPIIELEADQGITCSVSTPVNIRYQVEGGDFTGLDSGVVVLSPGLGYVYDSFSCNSMTTEACPQIDRIEPDPNHPGGTLIFFSYAGVTLEEDEIIDFTIDVVAQEGSECGQLVNIEVTNYVTITGLECEGVECMDGASGITGTDTLELEVIHPILNFNNLEAHTITGSDYLEYTGSILVTQRALSEGDSMYITVYCADTDGTPLNKVDSILFRGPVDEGEMVDFTGYIPRSVCDLTNGLVFSVNPVEGCLCAEPLQFLSFDEIEEIVREFDLALIKTVDQPSDLKYGDTLVFDIQIFNQADIWADSFVITDYIPAGLVYLDTNDNLGWVLNSGLAKRTVHGPLLSGQDTTIQILLRLEYSTEIDAYLNIAEISEHYNPADLEDRDSEPDDDPNNDAGGKPESPSDDVVDGDGSGMPGDDNPATDEDDHDPALVKVADLALRKVWDGGVPTSYTYGDTLSMLIEVFNQGNVPTSYIEVTDYLPAGYTFIDDANINPGWDGADPDNPVYTWTGDTLYQGESTEIRIAVILNMVATPDSSSWTNYSEISHFRDTAGMELQDVDSTPDNDPTNDAGGQPDSEADDFVDGDGTGEIGDGIAETDEDDHDPLRLAVYDLALRKTVSSDSDSPLVYDATAIFDITVFNQGNESTQNIDVTDYVPTNMEFATTHIVNAEWDATDPANPVFTIPGPLLPGTDTTIQIALILRQEQGVNNWINYAEISRFEDLDRNQPDDIDSTPDNDPDNDYGAHPLGQTDDEITGNAKAPGTPNGVDDPLFDEDDHDVAIIDVVDLALIKVIDTLGSDFPLAFGSLIKFDIIIQNQGNVITDSVRVQDYVPAGYAYDHTLPQNADQGWEADGTVLLTKQLDFLEFDTVSLYLTLQPVADPQMDSWINYAEILHVYDTTGTEVGELDFDSSPGSDSEEERSVRPGDEGDDDFMSPHRDSLGSEDDHDPAGVMFLDLALYKQVDSTETVFPIRYGDAIRFKIAVINQEGIMADSVRVVDYVPEGYNFDPTFGDNALFGWQSDTTTIIHGPVDVGDTVYTYIDLELRQISVPTDRSWVNYSEILEVWSGGMEIGDMDIDSNPGSDSPEERDVYPGLPGDDDVMSISRDSLGSEDDHDPAHVEVFDLALTKTTAVEVGYPDLEVPFEITVYNQGGIPATNIEITDYVPAGFTFDPSLNPDWTGTDPRVVYVIEDTLYPGENIQVPIVLTVTKVLHPDSLVNVAEISAAQDTAGMNREDIDGVFDNDPSNDAGGKPDSDADNYVDGNGTGTPGDGVAATDEDNADPAKILPCLPVNCHAYINLALGESCEIEITADMLLTDNRLALAAPEFYKVELFYGPGIRIPDNILRPEHAGRPITARITFLIDECGGGTCEASIVLEKPNACLIRNTLDTTVYCIDPFLALDPMDAAYPKPELVNVCSGADLKLEVSPDWIMPVSCDDDNDTVKVILREWTAITPGGERCTGVDTIVVLRLPKLTPGAFVGSAEETFYCDVDPDQNSGGLLTHYVSWKQPVGLHDYELPFTKLRGVVYEIPGTIILAGLANAYDQGPEVFGKYLQTVILRKSDARDSVTIGDIVSGDYMDNLVSKASPEQKLYGFLATLVEGNENPLAFLLGSMSFHPYLLLQHGDWVLSANGIFEEVTTDWFYSGNGQPPYWFVGGWPSVYGSGSSISYCDAARTNEYGCIRIQVPRLIHGVGFDPEICDTICLTDGGIHCGITIDQNGIAGGSDWSGTCPKVRSLETTITQTCWAETNNSCGGEVVVDDVDLIASYDTTGKRVVIKLNQTQTLIDTIGPIFDFKYSADWDQGPILESIRNGQIPEEALAWERVNPTIYHVNSHTCEAVIFVPDVKVVDHCSDVYSVKAMVDLPGGTRSVSLIRTGVEYKLLANGDTCVVYTYSHLTDPIRVPFTGCDGSLTEIRYEAADQCWNQSEWVKYFEIVDETPPTIVADGGVNVTLNGKTEWVKAETFDEGSWDNCGIEMMLIRRSDWLDVLDICGVTGPHADGTGRYNSWVDILDDLGIRRSHVQDASNGIVLSPEAVNEGISINDLAVFLNQDELESYYFNQLVWMWEDGQNCGSRVVHSWIFALAQAIADGCSAVDEHGNPLKPRDLEFIFDNLFGEGGYGQEMALMGGGWAQLAPFNCTDACQSIPVELLVLDYCCNWGISLGNALVEDKGSARLQKPLADLEVECTAYNNFYKDIVDAAAARGALGSIGDDQGIFDALDEVFGTYVISWIDQRGQLINGAGQVWSEDDLSFTYKNVQCEEKSAQRQIPVQHHDGTMGWISQTYNTTILDTTLVNANHGIVVANCTASVVQDVWVDLDDCGIGTLTRRFFIFSGCGDTDPLREVHQVITVRPTCELNLSMFDLPESAGTIDAPICISAPLQHIVPKSGYLSEEDLPEGIDALRLKSHLAGMWCSALAFGTDIKEFAIEGAPGMKKYLITWSVKDWCTSSSANRGELEFVQEVIARIDPECAPTEEGSLGSSFVAGKIQTALNSPLEDIEVKAILDRGAPLILSTNSEGSFEFEMENGTSIHLIPENNSGHAEGITTADLIDIQRHILQKSALTNPFQKLAADVNGNGLIDGLDVMELRRIVLNPSRKFPNNTSWRFYESTSGAEIFEISNLERDYEVDFVGVKIGDVNMSSDPASRSRSTSGRLHLNVADRKMKGGEIYRVDVRSDNFEDILGLQFTMQYSSAYIDVVAFESGVLKLTEDNYYHFEPRSMSGLTSQMGLITASWSEGNEVSLHTDDVLFTIVVKARSQADLRDVIGINDRVVKAEAYEGSGNLRSVGMNFGASSTREEFALYQNHPNPYTGETTIGFRLPNATHATMTIYTVTGKLIKRIEGEFEAGYNELRISSMELGSSGVLYYQLDTDKYTATKKMIVLE